MGYTVPTPLQWSQGGRSLYFTNVPVPDGCVAYVNGGDLWRLDLADGLVTEIVPFVGLVLALSPYATHLAYYGSFGRGFTLRDLATDVETMAAVTVVKPDERHFTILNWLRDDEVRLLHDEGQIWYLEVFSGELAGEFDSE